jgi:hypothetical protein
MEDMHYLRPSGHGVALIGNNIYVVGGLGRMNPCETFDLKTGTWKDLPAADFNEFCYGLTLLVIKVRYAIAIGG